MKTDRQETRGITNKNRIILIATAAAGLVLLIFGGIFTGGDDPKTAEYTDLGFYTEYLEDRIRRLCTSVSGVDEAEVFLTIDCSSEYIYTEGGDYLILSGDSGEEAVMLCEIYPRVRGIAVVCTDGDSPSVKSTLTSLLSAALDLPSNKIMVAGGASSEKNSDGSDENEV